MADVLVTGSEGNIGTYLVAAIRRAHPDWRIIRVRASSSEDPDVHSGDLEDPAFVRSLFEGRDVRHVVHAAARSYLPENLKRPYDLYRHDLGVFLNVLDACPASVKRVTYLSSATVYENVAVPVLTEDATESAPAPQSALALAKWCDERALQLWAKQHDRSFTIWRLFNVVSPLEQHAVGGHVFVDLYRKLFVERAPRIGLFGGGVQERSFIWVEEAAELLASALDDARADRETFNLGGDEAKTMRELCETMLDIGHANGGLPKTYAPELVAEGAPIAADVARRIPDLSKVKRVFSWHPKIGFRACFERFIERKQASSL